MRHFLNSRRPRESALGETLIRICQYAFLTAGGSKDSVAGWYRCPFWIARLTNPRRRPVSPGAAIRWRPGPVLRGDRRDR
jgi:hypothetical protein